MRFLAASMILLLLFGCEQRDEPAAEQQRLPETVSQPAVPNAPVSAAVDTRPAFERPFLWRVHGEKAAGHSYLFGTIHGGIEVRWETLPAQVRSAIERSQVVVLEADTKGASSSKLASKLMLPREQSLKQALGPEKFEVIADLTEQPPTSVDRFRPWVVYSTLVQKWIGRAPGLDERIATFGEARGKELAYLETMEDQVSVLDRAISSEVLGRIADDPEAERAAVKKLVDGYRRGDEADVIATVFPPADVEAYSDFFRILFGERNEKWVPLIEARLAERPTFFAVGVGHLLGPHSVVSLLRERGYTVERVAAEPAPDIVPDAGRGHRSQ